MVEGKKSQEMTTPNQQPASVSTPGLEIKVPTSEEKKITSERKEKVEVARPSSK